MSEDEEAALAARLDAELRETFGSHVLTMHDLTKALNYKSISAVRQAVSRNTMPIPLFNLPNRRGKFALSVEVAKFLARQASVKDTMTEQEK
ncbi:MAG: hypothetical protein MK214_15715 [Thalassotalea sp.]|nr:hypothetical protein [Thalassotalea sp.]